MMTKAVSSDLTVSKGHRLRSAGRSAGSEAGKDATGVAQHLLSTHHMFEGVAEADLARLAADVKERAYRKGQYLCYAGDQAHYVFLIKSGLIALTEEDERGNPHAVHVFGAEDVFGAMVALLGEAHTGSAIAMTDSTAIVVPAPELVQLVRRCPDLSINIIRELHSIVCRAEETIVRLTTTGVAPRVAALLLKLCPPSSIDHEPIVIDPRLSHETIALLLGTTRRTVTRAFTRFSRAKLITMKNQRVVVVKPEALRRIAEGQRH